MINFTLQKDGIYTITRAGSYLGDIVNIENKVIFTTAINSLDANDLAIIYVFMRGFEAERKTI